MSFSKKLLILLIIIWALIIFYKKFIAPVTGPFFKEYKGKVDLFGTATPNLNKIKTEAE